MKGERGGGARQSGWRRGEVPPPAASSALRACGRGAAPNEAIAKLNGARRSLAQGAERLVAVRPFVVRTLAVLASLWVGAAEAFGADRAGDSEGDGVYGRLDGDLDLSAALGVGYAVQAPILVARASAIYAVTAGAYVGYTEAFGQEGALVDRSIAAGVTLRPLFWGRFANALQKGPARLDLLADSLAFEVGAFWAAPRGRGFESAPGLEIAAGLGLPILAQASGPWIELRAALRYRPADLAGTVVSDVGDRGAFVSLSFAWHQIVSAGIADAGDRLVR